MAVPVLDELLADIAHPVFDEFEGEFVEQEQKRDTLPCPPPDFDSLDLDDDSLSD